MSEVTITRRIAAAPATVFSFFTDAGTSKGDQGRADIVDGKYSIGSGSGPPPGKYRVEIIWYKKTGKQVVGSDPPNKEDETIQVIPEKYNKSSELKVELTSGSNTHDFPLKSGKKK